MSWWALLRAVSVRWRAVVLVTMATFAGVWMFVGSLPDVFSGRAVVQFTPRFGAGAGANELRALLPGYVVNVSSPSVLAPVAKAVDMPVEELLAAVSAAVLADSANVGVSVTLEDPKVAAQLANALADHVVRFAGDDQLFSARVVGQAVADYRPSGPPRGLFLAAGFVAALMCGLAAAALLERARPRVRTTPEVAQASGHQVLASVPSVRGLGTSVDEQALGGVIRAVRAALARQDDRVQVLVVTSAVPGEGKTTVAAALGSALARTSQRVLLVDADFRRRGLSRRFGMRPGSGSGQRPGLWEVALGGADIESAFRPGPTDGLWVLPASPDSEGADRVASGFPAVIAAARDRFDLVIVDAGALLVGGEDAESVAWSCDASVLVVGRDTPAHLVAEAAAMLRSLDVKVLGAVANGTRDPWLFAPDPTTTDVS